MAYKLTGRHQIVTKVFGEIWRSRFIIQPTLKTNNEVKHEPTIETQLTMAPHTNLYIFHCSTVYAHFTPARGGRGWGTEH